MMFTTNDRDNDAHDNDNSAVNHYKGGWWYNDYSSATTNSMRPTSLYTGDAAVDTDGLSVGYIDGVLKAVKGISMAHARVN